MRLAWAASSSLSAATSYLPREPAWELGPRAAGPCAAAQWGPASLLPAVKSTPYTHGQGQLLPRIKGRSWRSPDSTLTFSTAPGTYPQVLSLASRTRPQSPGPLPPSAWRSRSQRSGPTVARLLPRPRVPFMASEGRSSGPRWKSLLSKEEHLPTQHSPAPSSSLMWTVKETDDAYFVTSFCYCFWCWD